MPNSLPKARAAIRTTSKSADQEAVPTTEATPLPPGRRKTKRREQQRSIDTRHAILTAALNEFAERGFEGASMRRIGERAQIDFTLITYHFSNKDALWRAVAEWGLGEILDAVVPPESALSAKERVRVEFLAYFNFTTANPAFHNFMLRSMNGDDGRIKWLVETYLSRIHLRMRPQLIKAQANGEMAQGNPDLLYYLMIGAVSALSSLQGEMALTTGLTLEDSKVRATYWDLIDRIFFR